MRPHLDQPQRVHAVPAAATLGLALAAAPLTWWALGPLGTEWPDHDVGPYHVPVAVEVVIAVIAIVLAAGSLVAIIATVHHPARHVVSVVTTVLLVAAGVVGALGWRVATASGTGANIGGGMFRMVGPVAIAGLLLAAIRTETTRRGTRPLHACTLLILAATVAPLLYAIEIALARYDQSVGVISPADYATVQLGQTHDHVRGRLGPPGEVVDWFFATPASGSVCEYYDTVDSPSRVYRICYRSGVVVDEQTSDHPR